MDMEFQRKLDRTVGKFLCFLLSFFSINKKNTSSNPKPRKILVILLSEMGSLVLAKPMFEHIKRKYPGISVYVLLFQKNREILELLRVVPSENMIAIRDVSLTKFILEKYDYLPYTTDNHYGEYIAWAWEISNLYHGRQFWEGYEKYSVDLFERMKRAIDKGKGARLVRAGAERAIPIIEGILNNDNHLELSVNLPNDGIITNLPEDLVIECPAIVNNKGLQGLKLGEYPKGLAALLNTQAAVQDLVVEAILTRSKKVALQALLADPVVNSTSQAERILESMLDLQKNKIQIELV